MQLWRARQQFDRLNLPYSIKPLKDEYGGIHQSPMIRLMQFYVEDSHMRHLPLPNQLCACQGSDAYIDGMKRRRAWKIENNLGVETDAEFEVVIEDVRKKWDGDADWRELLNSVSEHMWMCGLLKPSPAQVEMRELLISLNEKLGDVLTDMFGTATPYQDAKLERERAASRRTSQAYRERRKAAGVKCDKTEADRAKKYRANKKNDVAWKSQEAEKAKVRQARHRAVKKIIATLPDDANILKVKLLQAKSDGLQADDYSVVAIQKKLRTLGFDGSFSEMPLESPQKPQECEVERRASSLNRPAKK